MNYFIKTLIVTQCIQNMIIFHSGNQMQFENRYVYNNTLSYLSFRIDKEICLLVPCVDVGIHFIRFVR